MAESVDHPHEDSLFAGSSEIAGLLRNKDWSKTELGPPHLWPRSLRTAIRILLTSRFSMWLGWGPSLSFFYNDAYRPTLGKKHPRAIGAPFKELWSEIWDDLAPRIIHVIETGGATWDEALLLFLERNGYPEETYHTFSYSPLPDDRGAIGGMLCVVSEDTERVIGERRLALLREVATRLAGTKTQKEVFSAVSSLLADGSKDLPFSVIYLFDENQRTAHLASSSLFPKGHPAIADSVELSAPGAWPLAEVLSSNTPQVIDLPPDGWPRGPWSAAPSRAVAIPIAQPGHPGPSGVFLAGLNPFRPFDEVYRDFLQLLVGQIAASLSNAHAYEQERLRAEALAELDRAKTVFFSNVSHEFRTPLTLMLAPAQDLLAGKDASLTQHQREQLSLVYRNGVRLQKLVNSLLDFSRIEAGKARAVFEPVDLAPLTEDIASVFRSTVERAGLKLIVRCEPLEAPIYVDREMWEKIVLNLISNAFKFTFEGEIELTLSRTKNGAELSCRDTGIGIAPAALLRVFERFHRVEGAKSRTHEGSGIGLSLARELARLHGGEISVQSDVGRGTRFVVSLPFGKDHLPQEQLSTRELRPKTSNNATAFRQEAELWISDGESTAVFEENGGAREELNGARILLADDNADMRAYISRLLRESGAQVEAVPDGQFALDAAKSKHFDLVLTDLMMPNLDGFGLIEELRKDPASAEIPIIMLSARAGEEERISGRRAGVDDYVTKPFSAKELLARVNSQLELSRLRKAMERQRHELLEKEQSARRETEIQKDHLYSLFMQAPTPIAILRGPQHVIELANSRICTVWGRAHEQVIGRPLMEAVPELRGQVFEGLLDGVFQTGIPYTGREAPARFDYGGEVLETIYFNFVYTPLKDHRGEIEGVLVIAFDVTHERAARERLEELRASAESANRAKDDFLAMLGHELRNPLAPISTALHLMHLRGESTLLRERTIIARQVAHLTRLVDDLLDVSRITRGKIVLKRKITELSEVVGKAIEIASPLFEQRQHRLTLEVPRRGLLIDADSVRLSQAIANLLMNAAKYTESRGEIALKAWRSGPEILFEVNDNGIGIAPEMIPRIFELFVQETQALDRARGGLGLGLAIVKSLVTMHDGRISAASEGRDRGSTFTIALPAAAAGLSPVYTPVFVPVAKSTVIAPPKGRVLVVDDNRDAAELLSELLTEDGFVTKIAHDGPGALRILAEFPADIALLDIGLPVMDGYELAMRIRREHGERTPRLIAVTGYGQQSDQRRTIAAGFEAHLVKPVDPELLSTLLKDGPDVQE